jgi:hypothetical protein
MLFRYLGKEKARPLTGQAFLYDGIGKGQLPVA